MEAPPFRAGSKALATLQGFSPGKALLVFAAVYVALLASHWPLLSLPYFWDEAGYYIPAARDVLLLGQLIPTSTLTNAHPPLVMVWLAAWWKLFGYAPVITRAAMLFIAAFGIMGALRLGQKVAGKKVAVASTALLAVYPVFFAQSSLAHVDLAAAALIWWGLGDYLEKRYGRMAVWFALAMLAKETALLIPLALIAWEILRPFLRPRDEADTLSRTRMLWLTASALPLLAWFAFHYASVGYVFGNPEYVRYNVATTFHFGRFLMALLQRVWHLAGHMNMIVLTALMLIGMAFAPLRNASGERPRIALPAQLLFGWLIVAHVAAYSIVGGALLVRYLLPVYPLVMIVAVSTLWRRLKWWPEAVALVFAVFLAGLFFNPPYRFAPEDNLAYGDFVRLQEQAANFVEGKYPQATVLTAWPASDELTKPWLGYVKEPIRVLRIEDFSREELEAAAQGAQHYDLAVIYSRKYEPQRQLVPRLRFWEEGNREYFQYRADTSVVEACRVLGGRAVLTASRGGQWIAVIEISHLQNAHIGSGPLR